MMARLEGFPPPTVFIQLHNTGSLTAYLMETAAYFDLAEYFANCLGGVSPQYTACQLCSIICLMSV